MSYLKNLIMLCVIMVASAIQAEIISFTQEEGYESGSLVQNELWAGTPEPLVNADKGIVSTPRGQFFNLIYQKPISIDLYQKCVLGVSFSFSKHALKDTKLLSILKLDVGSKEKCSKGITLSRKYFRAQEKYRYFIKFYSKYNDPHHVGIRTLVEDEQILSRSAVDSDILYLRLSIEKGTTKGTWNATGSLYNISNYTSASEPIASTTSTFTSPDDLIQNRLIFPGIHNGNARNDPFLTSLTIDKFIFTQQPDDPQNREQELLLVAQTSNAFSPQNQSPEKKREISERLISPQDTFAEEKVSLRKRLTLKHALILAIGALLAIITGSFLLFKHHL